MIVSQSRHENFSRTVWITFHCRGITSSVSVMSSPSFDSFDRAAAGAALRRGDHDALARQMIGERLARRPLALERLDGLRLRRRLLGRQFVFGRGCLQLFELKLHLLQQPRLALRAAAVKLAPQLLDLELEVADQGFGAPSRRQLPLWRSPQPLPLQAARRARRGSSHARRQDRWGAIQSVGHDDDGITSITIRKPKPHPTDVGRHVSCGCRQSIPDNR